MSIFNPEFYTRNPKLGFQFKVEFDLNIPDTDLKSVEWSGKDQYINRVLSTCVDGVTIPSIKIKSNPYVASRMYNSYIYDYSDMALTINFSENDDMVVNKFLMMLSSVSRGNVKIGNKNQKMYEFIPNSYMRVYNKDEDLPINFVTIKVFEMDIGKTNNNNYKSSLVHVFENCYLLNQENIAMEYIEKPKGVTMKIDFGFMRYYIENPSLNSPNTSNKNVITDFINEEQKRELEFLDALKKMPPHLNIEAGKKIIDNIYKTLKDKGRTTKTKEGFYYGYSLNEFYNAAAYFDDVFKNVQKTIKDVEDSYAEDGYVLSMDDFRSIIHENGNVTGFIFNNVTYDLGKKNIIEIAKMLAENGIDAEDFKANGKIIYGNGYQFTYKQFIEKVSHDAGRKMDLQLKRNERDEVVENDDTYKLLKNDVFILTSKFGDGESQNNLNYTGQSFEDYKYLKKYVLKAYEHQQNVLYNQENVQLYNDMLRIHKSVGMYDKDVSSFTQNKTEIVANNNAVFELKRDDISSDDYMKGKWIDYGQPDGRQYDIEINGEWYEVRFFRNNQNGNKTTFTVFKKGATTINKEQFERIKSARKNKT